MTINTEELLDRVAERAALRGIDPETGEVRRSREKTPLIGREARVAGFVGVGDPDARLFPPECDTVEWGNRRVALPFAEGPELAQIGAELVERQRPEFAKWGIRLGYLWGENLGKENGEPKLWKARKADAWTTYAFGRDPRRPELFDAFFVLNSRVASYSQFTGWQAQAAIQEFLRCCEVRDGILSIKPRTVFVQTYVIRRYGNWEPDLRVLEEALHLAEGEQLPLWEDEDEGDDGDE